MDLIIAFAYAVGSVVCHQLPERSFFWGERQFPVCARCTGLYLGGAAGLLGWWAMRAWHRRPLMLPPSAALRLMMLAALPTLVSLLLGAFEIADGTNAIRAALALPLGVAAGGVVAAVSTKDLR